jgi:hypothetical protein
MNGIYGGKQYVNLAETLNKPHKSMLDIPTRKAFGDYLKYGSSAQVDRFYSQINSELVKKVVVDKFTREADKLSQRKKRERQRILRETTQDLVSGFKMLSKVYFNKSKGDQLLTAGFQEIISDFGIKDLISRRNQVAADKSRTQGENNPAEVELPRQDTDESKQNQFLPRSKMGTLGKYLRRPSSNYSTAKNLDGSSKDKICRRLII